MSNIVLPHDFRNAQSEAPPAKQSRSRQQEQLEFLLHRQAQFKEAALIAKKKGDMERAKDLLRQAKVYPNMLRVLSEG